MLIHFQVKSGYLQVVGHSNLGVPKPPPIGGSEETMDRITASRTSSVVTSAIDAIVPDLVAHSVGFTIGPGARIKGSSPYLRNPMAIAKAVIKAASPRIARVMLSPLRAVGAVAHLGLGLSPK